MRRIIFFLFIGLSIIKLNAQQFSFSDSAVVSLITCSPGHEVYAKFGHTAIRINDPIKKIDYVFNYGMFSFDTEDFYYKFIKGETDYQLGVFETGYFLPEYKQRNSAVYEQVLNLNIKEKRNICNLLLENYQPENRIYRYNFVFDNCATRPRDKILTSLQGYASFETDSESKTFRQLIGNYVGTDTWLKLGIDIIFGLEADRIPTQSESMFLPDILMNEFETAKINGINTPNKKLVKEKNILIAKVINNNDDKVDVFSFKPLTISLLLLLIGSAITAWDVNRRRHLKWFDSSLLITSGLAGFIILFLMFFSSHPLVKSNLNLLWLNPLSVILGILMWIKSTQLRRILFFYQIFNIILLIGALFAFALSVQSFNVASFPIIVLILMRCTSWFAYTKRKLYKRRELK